MFRSKVPFYLLVLMVLGACSQTPVTPEPLEFANDPRVLRGTWAGESDNGHTLRLELTANTPSKDGYEIEGMFELDDEAPTAIEGLVGVPVTSAALSVQTSIPCAVIAYSADNQWEFCSINPRGGEPPRLEITLYRYAKDGTGTEAYNFSLTKTESANVLVQGDIIYVRGEPFTYPGGFKFTEGSHAVVQLYYSVSALGDGPVELVAETRIENITGFPLSYRIAGDPKTAFARQGDYFLFVDVFSGAGDKAVVGDLTNEMYTPVPSPSANVEVKVIGLEACDSPDAGGVCA